MNSVKKQSKIAIAISRGISMQRTSFFTIIGLAASLMLTTISFIYADTHLHMDKTSETTYKATITIDIAPEDFIDKDSIQLSVDHPNVQVTQWHIASNFIKQYDPTYKETRKIISDICTLSVELNCTNPDDLTDAFLHIGYYQDAKKGMVHEQLRLAADSSRVAPVSTTVDTTGNVQSKAPSLAIKSSTAKSTSWSSRLSHLVEKTESTGIRIILVLLLGLLMSLTPCIYPMIPITVGILQAQGSKSFLNNCMLSLAYTVGIATTFAALGLTAALTGQIFGSIMSNPIFILAVVAVLAYLGFSMLGFYDMYTPKFMRNANNTKGGSVTAAFLFGAASGTVASPCLSPGLILLLSIVATLGSKLLGFILLFAFGVGLSIPLLIIGTFSTSLMLLPQAGMWMVEIKKFFGLLLFGMCFYFLNNILPWPVLLGLGSITLLASGIFYLQSIAPYDSKLWRGIKNLCGITFIASSMFLGVQTFQAVQNTPVDTHKSFWLVDYQQALAQATQNNTYLFIDIGAPYCSICKTIDKTILAHPRVMEALKKYVPVKIDASENTDVMSELQKKYHINGVPTLLLINHNGDLIKKWGSEIYYDLSIDQFIEQLNQA